MLETALRRKTEKELAPKHVENEKMLKKGMTLPKQKLWKIENGIKTCQDSSKYRVLNLTGNSEHGRSGQKRQRELLQ